MGSMSIWHWLIVLVVVLLVFGSGKLTTLMGDLAKGIKVFKKNIAEDESAPASHDQGKGTALSGQAGKGDDSVPFYDEKTKTSVPLDSHK